MLVGWVVAQVDAASGSLYLIVLVSVIYIALIRIADVNEREPLWAITTFFGLGAVTGILVSLIVGSETLVLERFAGTIAIEISRFTAFALGLLALLAIERWRGWSEIDGVMDGVIYGFAIGLGVATGRIFIGAALIPEPEIILTDPLTMLWTVALVGLSDGLFGAIIGAGFGYARRLRASVMATWLSGVGGLVVAILTHLGYQLLTQPEIGAGQAGLARRWVGLAIPLVLVAIASGAALFRERKAISTMLSGEPESVVSDRDRRLLEDVVARRRHYAKLFFNGRFDEWQLERTVHNRLVKLALAKLHGSQSLQPDRLERIHEEVDALRNAVESDHARLAKAHQPSEERVSGNG